MAKIAEYLAMTEAERCQKYITVLERMVERQARMIDRLVAIAGTTLEGLERQALDHVVEKFATPQESKTDGTLN